MAKQKLDTQAIGLDAGLAFTKWLTGAENLHYGLWTGLEVTAGNLRAAQDAYTDKLFKLLPDTPVRILDIGGGAGETAKKLLALGHSVDIVVPSPFLAARCRENAPDATVYEHKFEDFQTDQRFDLCLFSESYQYIPLDQGLTKCLELLTPEGHIIISDCFRTQEYSVDKSQAKVGGGHREWRFREMLETAPVGVISEEDITEAVAPSVDLEQALFNVFGYALTRVDQELSAKRPKIRWMINRVIRLMINDRKRARLDQRLNQKTRTAENFIKYNRYVMMKLRPTSDADQS
ncbi:class I SAM-dependent methyltransferase [Parasulfitobacter algicola]|uniref:Class I SAM-dependent methyltransferase n=1 Tax=Parasulfitobacter algicola TaxID=2614809 RepID=A0ABX2IV98_9RHOB|nr:class I SAM-dependent methyltransferase [Sulfitobacter algicola]NSX56849.1 class I SAM-dependent methyltransferase [Sulfitobacter algicola]